MLKRWIDRLRGRSLPGESRAETKRRLKREEALKDQLDAEAEAARAGRATFESARTTLARSSPLLRRNVHRLEKGLCMPDRRPVFGTKFIGETVDLYRRLHASASSEPGELKWAHDVLTRYFEAVDTDAPEISEAFADWRGIPAATDQAAPEFAPYPQGALGAYVGAEASLPDLASFAALCRARRSQRWFAEREVTRDDIADAVEVALQAPSACNRQPFDYYFATSRETVAAITSLPLGTAGFGSDLPAVIAVVGDLANFAESRDRHLIFTDAGLATMQLMLALTAKGLGSVPINWPDLPDKHAALRDLLGLRREQVPVMLVGIGFPKPDCAIPYSAKRPAEDVLHVVD